MTSCGVNLFTVIFPERGHPLSTDQKFAENLIFLTPWYANVRVRIRRVKNVSFSEIFAYAFANHPTLQHLCLLVCSRPIDAFHNRIYSHLRVGIQILHQKHSLQSKSTFQEWDWPRNICHNHTCSSKQIWLKYYEKQYLIIKVKRSLNGFFFINYPWHLLKFSSNSNRGLTLNAHAQRVLTHSFPMHPFSIPWKHQRIARFSDVFREYRKGALETNRLIVSEPCQNSSKRFSYVVFD